MSDSPRARLWALAPAFLLWLAVACEEGEPKRGLPLPAAQQAARASTQPAAQPATPPAAAKQGDRCEHGLPGHLCTQCKPALAAVFKAKGDWCAAHGFPESYCPICNPGAAAPDVAAEAAAADWCAGHGLPESKCTRCNPSLIPGFKAAGDYCESHGFPESACPVCNPQEPPTNQAGLIEGRVVRLKKAELERSAGIQTVAARKTEVSREVRCTARMAFDHDRTADIRAIVPGVVRRVRVKLGAKVARGAILFDLESTRVGEIQGALGRAAQRVSAAQANLKRQRELRAGEIASARQVEVAQRELASAEAEARTAEAKLRMAGAASTNPSGRYALTSPIAGTLVRRPAMLGFLATEADSLATVVDTSVMWALCQVPETDAQRVALGQKLLLAVEGGGGEMREGAITWIAAEVDPRTRTVTVRAEVPNPVGKLRANQFGRARIQTSHAQSLISVPRAAVQRVGDLEVVFLRHEAGVYEPRVVKRRGGGDWVQVEGRIEPGDAVVTTGAILLRTEILPGSIGAGCCEVDLGGEH